MRKVSTHNLKHMINEEIDHIKNEIALINIIERKANAIISEDLGYERSNDLMVEFLDSFSKVPGYESASQTIKQNIALWLMERIAARFGYQPNSLIGRWFFRAIANLAGELSWRKFSKYFSEGGCPIFVDDLARAMLEATVVEPLYDEMEIVFFGQKGGGLSNFLREVIGNYVHDIQASESFRDRVAQTICGESIPNMVSDITGKAKRYAKGLVGGDDDGVEDVWRIVPR